MSKKILLIENDAAFAAEVSQGLEQAGFDVRVTGEGKEGLDLAREWGPAAIVLCVELPGMSGYLVCQKLRKDDALKAIPLVLTSAEATADTFEKHKALKVRADAYQLKPYGPDALLETLGALVGLPERAGDAGEEELVSLEEEMGLEGLPPEPEAELPELDLGALPEEAAAGAGADESLALLDDAFEGLTAPRAETPAVELDLQDEPPAPADDEPLGASTAAAPAQDGLGLLDDETEAALGALGAAEPLEPPPPTLPEAELDLDAALGETSPAAADPGAELDRELEAVRPPVRGASADALRAAGIRLLDEAPAATVIPISAAAGAVAGAAAATASSSAAVERLQRQLAEAQQALADARAAGAGRDTELRQARARSDEASRRADAATRRAEEAESALSEKDVELASARAKGEAAVAQSRRLETDLKTAREEARRAVEQARTAEDELQELRDRLAAAERRAEDAEVRAEDATAETRRKAEELAALEETSGRADALARELDEARAELLAARGEADGARAEVEKRTAELKKRVAEVEAANAKHEERVLKAYQKIKNDEKVKDKVRKAIAIAAQLLEEGMPAETPADKERRAAAAAALGRDPL